MFTSKYSYLTIAAAVVTFIFSESATANRPSSARKSNRNTINMGLSIIGAEGSMGNGLDDVPDRKMLYMPVQFFFGLRLNNIRISAAAEYLHSSQITNAAEVTNTNIGGTGIAFGPRIDYYDGKQSFGVFYRASDTYELEKLDINNNKQQYKANAGYTIQYTRQLKGNLGFVIDYTQEEFKESVATGPVKWNRAGLGIIFSNFDNRN